VSCLLIKCCKYFVFCSWKLSGALYNNLIIACDLCFFSPVKFCSFNTLMYPSKNIYWQKLWIARPPQRVNQGNRNRLVRFGKGKQQNCILCTTPNIRSRAITIWFRWSFIFYLFINFISSVTTLSLSNIATYKLNKL
jgi:hypothetical protein